VERRVGRAVSFLPFKDRASRQLLFFSLCVRQWLFVLGVAPFFSSLGRTFLHIFKLDRAFFFFVPCAVPRLSFFFFLRRAPTRNYDSSPFSIPIGVYAFFSPKADICFFPVLSRRLCLFSHRSPVSRMAVSSRPFKRPPFKFVCRNIRKPGGIVSSFAETSLPLLFFSMRLWRHPPQLSCQGPLSYQTVSIAVDPLPAPLSLFVLSLLCSCAS